MFTSLSIEDIAIICLKLSSIGLLMGFFGAIGMALAFWAVGYFLEIDEKDGVIGH